MVQENRRTCNFCVIACVLILYGVKEGYKLKNILLRYFPFQIMVYVHWHLNLHHTSDKQKKQQILFAFYPPRTRFYN